MSSSKVRFLSLAVDITQSRIVLRHSLAGETEEIEKRVSYLRDEVTSLKDKERNHLEEIKKLLVDKVDLQSVGISQREKALEREKDFRYSYDFGATQAHRLRSRYSDIRAALAAGGAPPEVQQMLAEMQNQNQQLSGQLAAASTQLEQAKNVS